MPVIVAAGGLTHTAVGNTVLMLASVQAPRPRTDAKRRSSPASYFRSNVIVLGRLFPSSSHCPLGLAWVTNTPVSVPTPMALKAGVVMKARVRNWPPARVPRLAVMLVQFAPAFVVRNTAAPSVTYASFQSWGLRAMSTTVPPG